MHDTNNQAVPAHPYGEDIEAVLVTEEDLQERIQEMADRISEKYRNTEEDLILVCVLKGAVFFLTDFARKLSIPSQLSSWRCLPTATPHPRPAWCVSSRT